MKGYSIDCNYIKRVIDYLGSVDDFEIVEMPIISIDTGVWDFGE